MGYYNRSIVCEKCSEGFARPTPRECLIDRVVTCPYCGGENETDYADGIAQLVERFEEEKS